MGAEVEEEEGIQVLLSMRGFVSDFANTTTWKLQEDGGMGSFVRRSHGEGLSVGQKRYLPPYILGELCRCSCRREGSPLAVASSMVDGYDVFGGGGGKGMMFEAPKRQSGVSDTILVPEC